MRYLFFFLLAFALNACSNYYGVYRGVQKEITIYKNNRFSFSSHGCNEIIGEVKKIKRDKFILIGDFQNNNLPFIRSDSIVSFTHIVLQGFPLCYYQNQVPNGLRFPCLLDSICINTKNHHRRITDSIINLDRLLKDTNWISVRVYIKPIYFCSSESYEFNIPNIKNNSLYILPWKQAYLYSYPLKDTFTIKDKSIYWKNKEVWLGNVPD